MIVLWLAAVGAQSLRMFKNIYIRWLYVLGGGAEIFSDFFSLIVICILFQGCGGNIFQAQNNNFKCDG